MRLFSVFIFMLLNGCFLPVKGQDSKKMPVFPHDWLGVWEGDIHIYKGQEIVQTVAMRVDNMPTEKEDVYTWALTYGDDTIAGRRDYVLRPVDKFKGLWETDEQNSIRLDGRVVGNAYISVFTVENNTLVSKMSVEETGKMVFEIIVYGKESSRTTGNTISGGEKIPEVLSYAITGYQKATLHKVR